jgi:microsomal dipeptidase-like Zn-dependent dipeptidase
MRVFPSGHLPIRFTNSPITMQAPFIDFHCHPALKPYGRSFQNGRPGHNSPDRYNSASLFKYDPPRLISKGLQAWAGICKFSQADCTTLLKGNSRIVCASIYPIERGFFKNSLGQTCANENVNAFISSIGRGRVQAVENVRNYFEDLCAEYAFYRELDGKAVMLDEGPAKYRLARNWAEIENWQQSGDEEATIFFVMTIEGLHVLMNDMDAPPQEADLLENLRAIKSWEHAPFFVTLAHHFNNHLCGHAKSLFDLVGKVSDQSEGVLTGFTDLGRQVLHETLSTANGRRIYIDIKHMSPQARKEYFQMLDTDYAGQQIPVIASHAAAAGLKSMDNPVPGHEELSPLMLAEGINFYDDEIVRIARSGGIYGLQLDERRAASKAALKAVKSSMFRNEIRHNRAGLLWNGIRYVAELLDREGLPAWDCLALGTDFDATIDPLNGFLTAESLPALQSYLERHAFNYMNAGGKKLRPANQISSGEIVNRIFTENGTRFLKKWFV